MNEQPLSIETFDQLLQQWNGSEIKITKHELQDEDVITMHLEHITYGTDETRLDEYMPLHALFLHGEGSTETDMQQVEPLPTPFYEIPLQDSTQYLYDHSSFSLKTDRATYTIERV
ncbi:hypothetical protein [Halobacillus litoralis]|uniref:hypothetical protein n=1 Tax=Halobacillus litoralis TaxID=45668 RepID=UPI001CFE022F|nr:hypothetical protein [Halobacillus litoralis]